MIAVIGASASGKSHFLATVVYQLLEKQVGKETWTVSLKDEDRRSFRTKLLDPLFEDLEVLPRTQAQVEGELCLPLENRHDGRRFLLVFRDLGGEIFLQPERLRKLNFLRYAQGVVLMADPLGFEPPPSGNGGGALAHLHDREARRAGRRDVGRSPLRASRRRRRLGGLRRRPRRGGRLREPPALRRGPAGLRRERHGAADQPGRHRLGGRPDPRHRRGWRHRADEHAGRADVHGAARRSRVRRRGRPGRRGSGHSSRSCRAPPPCLHPVPLLRAT